MNSLLLTLLLGFAAHPRRYPTYLAYINGFTYGFSLNILTLLVPLHAIDLGFRLSDQGIIVAAPAVFMVALRLPGGAIADRFGERIVMWFGFASLIICAAVASVAATIWLLIVAQLFNGASRSVYWSAGQSYASRSADGGSGQVLGRLLGCESIGGICGAVVAGFVAQAAGFSVAFVVGGLAAAVGFLVIAILPALPRRDQVRSIMASFAPIKTMLFKRSLAFAYLVSFMAAVNAGLVGGLFIAFFRDLGYSEGETGVIRSLNSVGVASLAFFFGWLLTRLGNKNMGMLGMISTGAVSVVIAYTGSIQVAAVALMALTGVTFGCLRALYPTLASDNSTPGQRGLTLSVVSLYWAVAMLLSPLIFGFIADGTSIRFAISLYGGFAVAVGLVSPLVYRFSQTAAAAQPSSR